MNFLTLCKTLARECGAPRNAPFNVTGQTGESARFVEWIRQANIDIQSRWANWKFLWSQLSVSTVAGTNTVNAPVDLGAWDRERFRIDGQEPLVIDYWAWEQPEEPGNQKPTVVIIMPDNSLRLYPTPDAAYTLTGDYYKSPQVLTSSTDIPYLPEKFHDVIVLFAMIKYAHFEAADEVLSYAQLMLNERLPVLEADQLPNTHQHYFNQSSMVIRPE